MKNKKKPSSPILNEDPALRLDRIMAYSLYPRIFTKQQQIILKEALEMRKERLYDE